jgi:hypothetical protein
MKKLLIVAVVALAFAGCKKKKTEVTTGSDMGSGSSMAGSSMAGSSMAGSSMAGSGSDMAGSGSSMAGSGSDSGSAGSGSAAAGSGSGAPDMASLPVDEEGKRNWDCKKACKLVFDCKSKSSADLHDAKGCEQDCTSLAKDKDGRYNRGAAMGAGFYTCANKAADCDALKKCDL